MYEVAWGIWPISLEQNAIWELDDNHVGSDRRACWIMYTYTHCLSVLVVRLLFSFVCFKHLNFGTAYLYVVVHIFKIHRLSEFG
jgi:hypothetical protein